MLPDMDRRHTKTVVSRLLHQSILELCKASVPQEESVEIDGIVCISIGDDEGDQIVVKVHEQIGNLRSVGHVSSSQSVDQHRGTVSSHRLGNHTSDYQRKRQNLHSIASAASAKRLRMADSKNKVESSNMNHEQLKKLFTGDMQLLSTIKTEIPSDEELTDSENCSSKPQGCEAGSAQSNYFESTSSQNNFLLQDLECEHCKLLLPTFEELQAHNDQEHKTSTCGYCWRSFHSFSNYQQHLKSHRRKRSCSQSKAGGKETAIKWKKCGLCCDRFRSVSYIMEHLRSVHDFERCFTCLPCDEYFPSRQTFVAHRKESHADVQQCQCENCEIYLTYVEFKHHEKECFSGDDLDNIKLKHKEQIQHSKASQEEADDGHISTDIGTKKEDSESETDCMKKVYFKADSVLGRILKSDEAVEESLTMVRAKQKEPDQSKLIMNYSQKSSEDDSNSSQLSGSSSQMQEVLEIHQDKCNDNEGANDGDDGEEGDDEDCNNSDNEESETSLGDGSDFLSILAMPDIHAFLHSARESNHQFDQSYPHTTSAKKSAPHACQGPYRCQTCFFVIEEFEDFERHCFEMHCRYVCTYCAQTFANRRNLQRHIRRHVGDMPYVCDECGQRFYRDDNLRRHKLKHMTSVRFVCAYCSTPYENKNKLTSHLIGGHAIDVLKVTDQEIMKHVILKDDPLPHCKSVNAEVSQE